MTAPHQTQSFSTTLPTSQVNWLAVEARRRGKEQRQRITKSSIVQELIQNAMININVTIHEDAPLIPDGSLVITPSEDCLKKLEDLLTQNPNKSPTMLFEQIVSHLHKKTISRSKVGTNSSQPEVILQAIQEHERQSLISQLDAVATSVEDDDLKTLRESSVMNKTFSSVNEACDAMRLETITQTELEERLQVTPELTVEKLIENGMSKYAAQNFIQRKIERENHTP